MYFEYDLATHRNYNPKESHEVSLRRVQYLTWDLYPLLKYPESVTSKLFILIKGITKSRESVGYSSKTAKNCSRRKIN
ncbi:hypothetical protein ACLZX5_00200 [Enterococcus faecium]